MESESGIFQVKMVVKNILLESPGTHFMHMRVNIPYYHLAKEQMSLGEHSKPKLKTIRSLTVAVPDCYIFF